MFYHNERRFATRLVMIAVTLVVALIARTEAQDADTIIREQTTVIERFEPPPLPFDTISDRRPLPLHRADPAVRFDLGGESYGRAFDNGSATGDNGTAAAFELRQGVKADIAGLTDYSLFEFVDYRAVWNPPGRDHEFASLGSVGVGIRAVIGSHFNATAYVAAPTRTRRRSTSRVPCSELPLEHGSSPCG